MSYADQARAQYRAMLAQSRAFTERKRREREQREQQRAVFEQFSRIGWGHTAAAELAAIYVKSGEQ